VIRVPTDVQVQVQVVADPQHQHTGCEGAVYGEEREHCYRSDGILALKLARGARPRSLVVRVLQAAEGHPQQGRLHVLARSVERLPNT